MADLLIIETGNGGDLVLRGADLVMTKGIENEPYLSMFGGDADWWGNDLIAKPEFIWQSETDAAINSVALNSEGRLAIEQAVKNDSKIFGKNYGAEIKASVTLAAADRIEITVTINGETKEYTFSPDKLFKTYSV